MRMPGPKSGCRDPGWRRVDPTAAVAPERVERGLEASFAGSELLPDALARGFAAVLAGPHVLGQRECAVERRGRPVQPRDAGRDAVGHRVRRPGLEGVRGGARNRPRARGGPPPRLARVRVPAARTDPAATAYRRFAGRLARRGIERDVGEAPRDFARRVRRLRPDLGTPALAITETYLRLRYGPAPAAEDLRLLRGLVARFRP